MLDSLGMTCKTVSVPSDVRQSVHYDARPVLLSSSAQGRVSDARGDGDAYCIVRPNATHHYWGNGTGGRRNMSVGVSAPKVNEMAILKVKRYSSSVAWGMEHTIMLESP